MPIWLLPIRADAVPLPIVNEVLADPRPGWGDAGCEGGGGPSDAFVELVNAGDTDADLSDWRLADTASVRHVFPAGTVLAPGAALVVFDAGVPSGTGLWSWCAGATVTAASSGGLGLDAAGDTVSLEDPLGVGTDAVTWGAEGALGRSVVRSPELDPLGPVAVHDCAVGATLPFSPGTRPDGSSFADPPLAADPGCLPADTDADGLADDVETATGTDPALPDTDSDGLVDPDEWTAGTDPTLADTDSDYVPDGLEVQFGVDPLDPDSDDDGLRDGEEGRAQTDPLDPDTDGDGLSDAAEILEHKTNPREPDTDEDGLGDAQEIFVHLTDPRLPDSDTDGLLDGDEVERGTDPLDSDTDGGGTSDGTEVTNGTDPLDPTDDVPGATTPPITTPPTGDPHADEEIDFDGACACDGAAAHPGALGAIAILVGALLRRSRRTFR